MAKSGETDKFAEPERGSNAETSLFASGKGLSRQKHPRSCLPVSEPRGAESNDAATLCRARFTSEIKRRKKIAKKVNIIIMVIEEKLQENF